METKLWKGCSENFLSQEFSSTFCLSEYKSLSLSLYSSRRKVEI